MYLFLIVFIVILEAVHVYVIPPFGVVLLVYPPDYPRARSARGRRADKPQHHDKRWNKMFITVDWVFRKLSPTHSQTRRCA